MFANAPKVDDESSYLHLEPSDSLRELQTHHIPIRQHEVDRVISDCLLRSGGVNIDGCLEIGKKGVESWSGLTESAANGRWHAG